jgi:hypothetical protein
MQGVRELNGQFGAELTDACPQVISSMKAARPGAEPEFEPQRKGKVSVILLYVESGTPTIFTTS